MKTLNQLYLDHWFSVDSTFRWEHYFNHTAKVALMLTKRKWTLKRKWTSYTTLNG